MAELLGAAGGIASCIQSPRQGLQLSPTSRCLSDWVFLSSKRLAYMTSSFPSALVEVRRVSARSLLHQAKVCASGRHVLPGLHAATTCRREALPASRLRRALPTDILAEAIA